MTDYTIFKKKHSEISPDISVLDARELTRYQRLLHPDKQVEFLAARTFLKTVLSGYLDVPPRSVSLSVTANGKPYLPAIYGLDVPHFSLSHTRGNYFIGISSHPIGVDIECMRTTDLNVLRPFFCQTEWSQLLQLPDIQRKRQLFRLFTQKEAFMKAIDKQWGLDEISFHLHNNEWKPVEPKGLFNFHVTETQYHCSAVCISL